MEIKNQGDGHVRVFPSHEEGIFVFPSDYNSMRLTSIIDLGFVSLEAARQAIQPDTECAGAYSLVDMSGSVEVNVPGSENNEITHITSFREFTPKA